MTAPLELGGREAGRVEFIGWIADRFQERHAPPLPREDALEMATASLAFVEEECGPFGHADFGWSEADARAIADEEISEGWEFEP